MAPAGPARFLIARHAPQAQGRDGPVRRESARAGCQLPGRRPTPVWLGELCYQRPAQERVEIGPDYATRTYRLRSGALGGDQMILTVGTSANLRAAVLAVTEGGHHMLTAVGICGDYPPTDPPGFDDFVASLASADVAAAIAGADPLDDPVPFRFRASARHRYERLSGFPAGLLVTGAAVCSFNPIYGQGITVAAAEAMILRSLLARCGAGCPPLLPRHSRRDRRAGDIAASTDLAFAQVPGKRPAKVRLINAHMPRLQALGR